ncbi:MAG: bifunctional riboflavin kinase/FAD synthetase [Acidobacteriota bacterium]
MIPVYRGLDEIPHVFGACVAAIGNFDGVHRGHQEILGAVVDEARRRNLRAIAITFDPHPEKLLRPDRAPQLLTPMPERVRLLGETGIDAVVVLPFSRALAGLPAREFVRKVLVDALAVRGLHEGANFRFGRRAEGGIDELRAFGAEFGFGVTVHEAVHVHGMEVSSSAVRELVAAGDMRRARWMLGRPFALRGTQKRDRGVGTRLLVPTVNLAPYEGLLPANGVYVTRITMGERCFQAVTNVGNRPTFEDAGFSVETHILDFEPVEMGDDAELHLEFLVRVRDERRFATTDELKAQIMRDVARAQRFFRLAV